MNKLFIIVATLMLVIVAGCSGSSDAQEGANEAKDNQINEPITNETDVEEESDPIITVSKLSEDEQFELTVKIDMETSRVYKSIKNLTGSPVEVVSANPTIDVRVNNTEFVYSFVRMSTNLEPMEILTEELVLNHVLGENTLNFQAAFSIGDHGQTYLIEINDVEVDLKGEDAS